jgi:hypothetical protein
MSSEQGLAERAYPQFGTPYLSFVSIFRALSKIDVPETLPSIDCAPK